MSLTASLNRFRQYPRRGRRIPRPAARAGRPARVRPQVEALEPRLAPACTMRVEEITLIPPRHLLLIDCDAAADAVTLGLSGSNIQVNANGSVQAFFDTSRSTRLGVSD